MSNEKLEALMWRREPVGRSEGLSRGGQWVRVSETREHVEKIATLVNASVGAAHALGVEDGKREAEDRVNAMDGCHARQIAEWKDEA